MINKEKKQMIIEVQEDKELYFIKVSKALMPDFQKVIIDGADKKNIVVFFHLVEKD